MKQQRVWVLLVTLAALVLGGCMPVQAPATAKQAPLQFMTHLAGGMAEQDVFVAKDAQAAEVYRITPNEEVEPFLDAPIFTTAYSEPHDLFGLGDNPVGPYSPGSNLGVTLDAWLSATGSGTYSVRGDQAEMDLSFEGLMPNATYTVWCSTVALPPAATIIDEPCGAADGSENTFVTDAAGAATFQLTLPPLAYSTETVIRSIALAYHSDRQTYGSSPGDFGLNSHVHLFARVPSAESEAWQPLGEPMLAEAR